jgi:hypothetical protein
MLFIYLGLYLILSLRGRYEPSVIGLGGVKSYRWAPQGFVDGFIWNRSLELAFFPIYLADIRLWHTADKSYLGEYPINQVPSHEIGRVYQAWIASEADDPASTRQPTAEPDGARQPATRPESRLHDHFNP